jgi:hypothetical protein
MKINILKISILPLILLAGFTFTDFQPGNGKGNKDQGGKGKEKDRSDDQSKGNDKNSQKSDKDDDDRNENRGDDNKKVSNNKDYRNSPGNGNSGNKSDRKNDDNGKGKVHKEIIKWANFEGTDWNLVNFKDRKRPGQWKKVTVCHQTGSSEPVNITISENALKAHLSHGDIVGACTNNYDQWPARYVTARETVYNSYESTWETMSYSEALLKIALDKLLGVKTDLKNNRNTLEAQEIQRREVLIMELQNNTTAFNNQLSSTRKQLDGVNIVIQL